MNSELLGDRKISIPSGGSFRYYLIYNRFQSTGLIHIKEIAMLESELLGKQICH